MFIKILILIGLTRLLDVTHKPLLCAAIYVAFVLFMNLMFAIGGSASIASLALWSVVRFILASVYFGLLSRFDRGSVYWVVLVLGLFAGLV